MTNTRSLPPLSPIQARQIDLACDRFEAAWKANQRPALNDYVGSSVEPDRSALLRQLLLLDWDYRRRTGETPQTGDYQRCFPADATLIEDIGREMAAPGNSTRTSRSESHATHTPSFGEQTVDYSREAESLTHIGEPGSDSSEGRYHLIEEIGHGGIGVVFRGRDQHLGREIAVKVLRRAYRDNSEARKRFAAEARVGSQLQHPAIVPVYELGWSADRRPYLTMKLVEGHTFATLLRQRADPHEDLPHWLSIFEQVCQAMAYAHARGVVHRDLKPANIMVGAFGEVQVMDWGFAKVLAEDAVPLEAVNGHAKPHFDRVSGRDSVSHNGILMGTPAYMPPEQAQGVANAIGPRADVFALGAILCEILTGQPPYVATSSDEVCGMAAAGDLHDAQLRLDASGADDALRELAKRCLVVELSSRLPDAAAVAKDLTAFLASTQARLHQAQLERAAAEARAQAAGAKAKAERRARRLTLALAAALLIGTAVASWQAVVATGAKHAALAAAAAQTEAKELADAKEAETRSVLGFVQDRVFAAARPKGRPDGLGRNVTLRQALEAALPVVDKDFAGKPIIEARLRLTLATSFRFLGEAAIAAEQCQRARAIYARHLGADHLRTLLSMNNLANCYADLGRHEEALKIDEEVLALKKTKLGSEHPDTLSSMNNLAQSYAALGRHADACQLLEQTLSLRKTALGSDHLETIQSMNNLAACYYQLNRHDDALNLHEQSLAIQRARLGSDHIDTLLSMNNLAGTYAALGRHDEALKLCEEVLAQRRATLGSDHPDTLKSVHNLAICYGRQGRRDDAIKLQHEALSQLLAKLGPDHPTTLMSQNNLALSYNAVGRHTDALKLHEEVLARHKAKLGPDHPDTLRSMWGVAGSLVGLDRSAEAIPIIDDCFRRAAGQAVAPRLVPTIVDFRLRHFAKAKDAAGCRRTAEMWESLHRTDAASLYNAACYRAVAAGVICATGTMPGAVQEADAEADRAMAWLTQAVNAGYNDAAHIKKDPDLNALHDRADFRKLMAHLKAGD